MSHETIRPLFPRSVLIGALAVHAAFAVVYAYRSPEDAFDFDRYYEIAGARGRPHAADPAEHPIATVAVFRALACLPAGRVGFGLGIVGLNLLADAGICAALLWGWGEAAAAIFAVVLIFVLDLFFNRVDPWSVAMATLAIAAWRRNVPWLLGVALALGTALKLWPLALAGALVAPPPDVSGGERWFRKAAVSAFVSTGAVFAGATLLFGGWRSVAQVVTFRGAGGWQIEGFVGSLLHLCGAAARFESGSWRTGSANGLIVIALFAIAAPLCGWISWRGARSGRIGAGWLGAVSLLLLFSALFSAQYVIWLIPAAAICWSEGARSSTYVTALVVILTAVFWEVFPAVIAGHTPALAIVVLRNFLVLVGAILALWRAAQPRVRAP